LQLQLATQLATRHWQPLAELLNEVSGALDSLFLRATRNAQAAAVCGGRWSVVGGKILTKKPG
jgi:hypothetical protein